MKCKRCEKEKNEFDFPKKTKEFCKKCCQRIREKIYKSSEKGKIAQKKHNDKRQANGYFVKKYKENISYREKSLARSKKRWQVSPEKVRAEIKNHQQKHRDKYLARQNLRRAVFRGKILKPLTCQKCNMKKERIEGHHEDYKKPLEVIWLCVDCHKLIHGKLEGGSIGCTLI